MSDDQAPVNESAVPFSERVTIDALSELQTTETLDLDSWRKEPETALRLEGYRTLPHEDFYPNGERERVVVIIGPEEKGTGQRGVALYYSGHKELDGDYKLAGDIRVADPMRGQGTALSEIRQDEWVDMSFVKTWTAPSGQEFDDKKDLRGFEISWIQAGPLT